MIMVTASKGTSLWRSSSCISFASSMESLPPDTHTAIRSPGAISSYCRMARMKGRQMGLRRSVSRLCSMR